MAKLTVMRYLYFLISIIISFIAASCGAQAPKQKYPGQIDVKQMIGYYANTLPYPSTPGEFTEIQFYGDSTFLLYQNIIGRDSLPRATFGKWVDIGRLIQLDLLRGDTMNLLYNGKDMLLLNEQQDVIVDDAKYALFKQPTTSINLVKPFHVVAKFTYEAGAGAIYMCNINHTFPVMSLGAFEEAMKAFESRKNKDKDFFLEMHVHIEELPLTTGAATIYMAIDKVIGPVDLAKCPD